MEKLRKPKGVVREGLESLVIRPANREPVIDGIRALAILWVLLVHVLFFHYGTFPELVQPLLNEGVTKWIGQGAYGVDMFFVISGYLIGSLLFKEYQRQSTIGFKSFYARRFLRLIPVYTVVMLMGVYFMRNIPKEAILMEMAPSGNIEYAWANLLYVNNFVTVSKQYMPWCWSLAIEEQFYIVVPILLLLLMTRSKRPLRWMMLALIASGLIRLAGITYYDFRQPFLEPPDSPVWQLRFDMIYSKPYMRYAGLLAGVMGAYCSMFHRERVDAFFSKRWRSNLIGAASVGVFLLLACTSLNDAWVVSLPKLPQQLVMAYNRDCFSLAILGIIMVGVHGAGWCSTGLRRVLGSAFWFPIAQLSYSMYLTHEMFMLWGFPKAVPWLESLQLSPVAILWIDGIVVTLITIACSVLLFILVERPCMELRNSQAFRRLWA